LIIAFESIITLENNSATINDLHGDDREYNQYQMLHKILLKESQSKKSVYEIFELQLISIAKEIGKKCA
jgi:hypothetical protein